MQPRDPCGDAWSQPNSAAGPAAFFEQLANQQQHNFHQHPEDFLADALTQRREPLHSPVSRDVFAADDLFIQNPHCQLPPQSVFQQPYYAASAHRDSRPPQWTPQLEMEYEEQCQPRFHTPQPSMPVQSGQHCNAQDGSAMSPSAADSLLGRLTFDESLSEEPERYRYLAPPGPSTMESPFSASSAQFGSSDMLRAASWQHPHLAPLFETESRGSERQLSITSEDLVAHAARTVGIHDRLLAPLAQPPHFPPMEPPTSAAARSPLQHVPARYQHKRPHASSYAAQARTGSSRRSSAALRGFLEALSAPVPGALAINDAGAEVLPRSSSPGPEPAERTHSGALRSLWPGSGTREGTPQRSSGLRVKVAAASRSASTPVEGTEAATAANRRPVKRARKSSLTSTESGAAPPASPPPTSSSLPLVRSMSVRVVTGKGEFEFPAWKPHDAKPTSRRQCLSIRSNELGKVPKAEPLSDFSAETRVPTASRTTSDGPNSGWELEPRQSQSSDSSLLDCRRRSGCGARKVWEEGEPGAAEADLAAQDTASR